MARVCEMCSKEYLKGNQVPRGIGNRVTRRTIRSQRPNLRIKRFELGGQRVKLKVCASCLKKINSLQRDTHSETLSS